MRNNALMALSALMWFVCVSHILFGLAIMISPGLQKSVASLYSAQVDWQPQFVYILRPLGAFMLVLGVIGIAAALHPLRHRFIVYGFAGLLVIRVVQRIIFYRDIQSLFGLSQARLMSGGVFFLLLAVALLLLLYRAGRSARP